MSLPASELAADYYKDEQGFLRRKEAKDGEREGKKSPRVEELKEPAGVKKYNSWAEIEAAGRPERERRKALKAERKAKKAENKARKAQMKKEKKHERSGSLEVQSQGEMDKIKSPRFAKSPRSLFKKSPRGESSTASPSPLAKSSEMPPVSKPTLPIGQDSQSAPFLVISPAEDEVTPKKIRVRTPRKDLDANTEQSSPLNGSDLGREAEC
eukprot:TRINITY_DN3048_c0_g1_i1.p1 TRINITY_DN3048_c0_g1~~TRINITY_DN3048_c0_g1_i1.p1  ORF type:complete len:211 (-),score=67.99 TRINITY_DN3048_c0_g1_i1:79-711(-)